MRTDDFIIAISYLSIPVQIIVAISYYPKFASMPVQVIALLILFALFIFFCGMGHVFRCMNMTHTPIFAWLNWLTAIISAGTALYLLPMVPKLLGTLDVTIDDLKRLNESAENSSRRMLAFMSFLCHEIRNPLFAITSNVEFLGDDESLTESQRATVSSMEQSAQLMLRLVNDVLDINRLENGRITIENCTFDMHKLITQIADTSLTHIQQRHKERVSFTSTIDVPRWVQGDSTRVLQIVYNMLSNSIKFTQDGSVRLIVSAIQDPLQKKNIRAQVARHYSGEVPDEMRSFVLDGEGVDSQICATSLLDASEGGCSTALVAKNSIFIKVQVIDTGVGIPEERQRDIFKPFTQAKLSDYRQFGGTGLGLSIVSQLLKLMGGSIQVDSVVGQGSTFTAIFPVRLVDEGSVTGVQPLPTDERSKLLSYEVPTMENRLLAPEPVPCLTPSGLIIKSPPESKEVSSGAGNVLVTDDNIINVKIICRMLGYFGVTCHTASNGKEAVEQMMRSRNVTGDPNDPLFSLVLMDLSMPVMDGCEAIEIIRSKGVTVPIVALTANAVSESQDEAISAGATEFATKPILRGDMRLKLLRYGLIQEENASPLGSVPID